MKRAVLLILGIVSVAPVATAAANDFVIVPDKRVGPVTRTTRREQVAGLFPGAKVSHQKMMETPCFGEADDVMTFVEGKGWGLSICWEKGRPSTVLATGRRWRAPSGVRNGMTLPQVERVNGKPLMLHGFLGCYLAVGDGGRVKVSVLIGKDKGVCAFPSQKFSSDKVVKARRQYTVRMLGVELE